MSSLRIRQWRNIDRKRKNTGVSIKIRVKWDVRKCEYTDYETGENSSVGQSKKKSKKWLY